MNAIKFYLAMHRGSRQTRIGRRTHNPKISRVNNRPSAQRLIRTGRRRWW